MSRCKQCGAEKPAISKVKGLCNRCAVKHLKAKSYKKPKKKLKPSTKAGEDIRKFRRFARRVWEDKRDPDGWVRSEESGVRISNEPFDPKKNGMNVSHILSKGAHPDLYYDPRNVFILTVQEHLSWEFGKREEMKIYPAAMKIRDELLNKNNN